MLDGRYGARLNRGWEYLAQGLARRGIAPNTLTMLGLLLVTAGAAAYLVHRDSLILGLWLAIAFACDGLDGAVARLSGRSTRFGGYLDAVTDRYQEIAVIGAIAYVQGLWPAAFLAITGALLTSYNKARVALEIPVDNLAWPDLLERLERIIILIALLLLDGTVGVVPGTSVPIMSAGLVGLGVLAHATALQRFMRARRRLREADAPK
jgi:archaetidylinositol phosphate synthase